MRASVSLIATVGVGLLPVSAAALEPGEIDGEAVRLDVSNSTSVLVTVDNRNTRVNDPSSLADDDWGLFYNRFNTQLDWSHFSAGVRIDSAGFFRRPNPTQVALDLTEGRREEQGRAGGPYTDDDAQFFVQSLGAAGEELSNRYIHWTYPAKYHLGFTSEHVDVTVGDYYAQLGRGLVLSVRKVDELSSDTTIRGARATGRFKAGDVGFKLTALGGTANPLRIDEASGRYLGVDDSVTPNVIAVTEAGMPRTVASDFQPNPTPTYAPDSIFGAELEGGPKAFKLGVRGSLLERQDPLGSDVVRTANTIPTGSVSLDVPSIGDFGAGYVEVAVQDLQRPDEDSLPEDARVDTGYGIYGSVSVFQKPIAVTLEGKHYRRLYALQGNTDVGAAREYSLQYSAPPTTEAFWVDTEFENFNTCVSGGRAKTDLRIGDHHTVFAWVGHYRSWAESVLNDNCDISNDALNKVWDLASGGEIKSGDGKTSLSATVGARFDDTARVITDGSGNPTNTFYREGYLRHDFIFHLSGPFSLQVIGWHRRRQQVLGGPLAPWSEGETLTSLQWSPYASFVFGFEYDTNPATSPTYFNGQIVYKVIDEVSLGLFVGQRRGAIRCAAGVCRYFPPFEGGRFDVNVRF
jgi:hypothetical protein